MAKKDKANKKDKKDNKLTDTEKDTRQIVDALEDFKELAVTDEFTAVAMIATRAKGEPETYCAIGKNHRPLQLLGAVEHFCIQQHLGLFIDDVIEERLVEIQRRLRKGE
jgi:hypothetical protein